MDSAGKTQLSQLLGIVDGTNLTRTDLVFLILPGSRLKSNYSLCLFGTFWLTLCLVSGFDTHN